MSLLLKEIMRHDTGAADVLKQAELYTDNDLRSLTRQDLHDLFPGAEQFKLRRAIFDIIHKQNPVEKLLRDVKKFIPDQSFRDALTNNGVLVDYLQILKDMKSQMINVQSFLDAHINLLEEYGTKQPDQISACHDPPKLYDGQPAGHRQVARDASDSSDQMTPSPGSHSQGGRGEVMSLLLKEIMRDDEAADVLKRAELNTDKDLRSLTRQDLHDLFPGAEQFKRRRAIFDIIHKQNPVEKLLRDVKKFIPDQSFRDALTNNGVLVDYLQILKDMKSQMNNVQSFLDAHIDLLEEYGTKQPDQISAHHDPPKLYDGQPAGRRQVARDASDSSDQMMPSPGSHQQGGRDTGSWGSFFQVIPFFGSTGGTSTSATCGPVKPHNDQTNVCPQRERGASTSDASRQTAPLIGQIGGHPRQAQTVLMYQMVIAGKTFDAHLQLMDKVKYLAQHQILLFPSDENYQFTFVFCPISSRIASDVEAAMGDVKGNKPVILVLMHHTREVKYTTPMKTWREDVEVILHVNVFYHETVHGLLKCEQNNAAASQICDKLLEHFIRKSEVTSGNAQAVGAESGLPSSASVRGGGNNRRSDTENSSSFLSKLRRN